MPLVFRLGHSREDSQPCRSDERRVHPWGCVFEHDKRAGAHNGQVERRCPRNGSRSRRGVRVCLLEDVPPDEDQAPYTGISMAIDDRTTCIEPKYRYAERGMEWRLYWTIGEDCVTKVEAKVRGADKLRPGTGTNQQACQRNGRFSVRSRRANSGMVSTATNCRSTTAGSERCSSTRSPGRAGCVSTRWREVRTRTPSAHKCAVP